jgi:hypothetical protein
MALNLRGRRILNFCGRSSPDKARAALAAIISQLL